MCGGRLRGLASFNRLWKGGLEGLSVMGRGVRSSVGLLREAGHHLVTDRLPWPGVRGRGRLSGVRPAIIAGQ